MSQAGSVTDCIGAIKQGNHEVVGTLLGRYFRGLIRLAHGRLRGVPGLACYGEDVALSAFKSVMMGAEQGKFSRLLDRDDLWGLLVRITLNKAIDLYRKERRQPRMVEWEIERIISQEPTPEVAAQVTEEYQELLNSLGDETLRAIALWKVEGHTNEEIAAKLDCATRSVERKLRRIRSIWKNRSESPGA